MNGGGFNSSAPNSTPKFDNLLLHSLMSRLQLQSPMPPISPAKSLEDLLFSDLLLNLSDSDPDSDSEHDESSSSTKTQLAKEESRLEKEIIRTILSGDIQKLKPNSGQAITIRDHHICVGFQQESGSDYRIWEWHGHIMLFDDENGYNPEYIYGNYFERVGVSKRKLKKPVKKESDGGGDDDEKEEDSVGNVGLKELIEGGDSGSGRVLHRNLNVNSGAPRCV